MEDGTKRERVWRALHAAGAAALLGIAASVALSLPARAQVTSMPGIDTMAPCLETHFDPDLYRQTLADAGWQVLDAASYDTSVAVIGDAMAPLADYDLDWSAPEAPDLRRAAQDQFAGFARDRTMFIGTGDALLLLAGDAGGDGRLRVTCVRATQGVMVQGLIESLSRHPSNTADSVRFPGGIWRLEIAYSLDDSDRVSAGDVTVRLVSTQSPDAIAPPLALNEAILIETIWTPSGGTDE